MALNPRTRCFTETKLVGLHLIEVSLGDRPSSDNCTKSRACFLVWNSLASTPGKVTCLPLNLKEREPGESGGTPCRDKMSAFGVCLGQPRLRTCVPPSPLYREGKGPAEALGGAVVILQAVGTLQPCAPFPPSHVPNTQTKIKLQVREPTFLCENVFSLKAILKTSTVA